MTERSALPVPERDALDSTGHSMTALAAEEVAEFSERWSDGQLRAAAKVIRSHGARPRASSRVARPARSTGSYECHREFGEGRSVPGHQGWSRDRSGPLRTPRVRPRLPGELLHRRRPLGSSRHPRACRCRGSPGAVLAELAVEAKAGSAEGRRALNVAATRGRSRGEEGVRNEVRALTSGASSAGAFVPPIFLLEAGQFAL